MDIVDKVAWIRIENGRLLCARSSGKDLFYLPGGKREPGESDEACLLREAREELNVSLCADTVRPMGTFEAPAHGKPEEMRVRVACYGADYRGALRASAEIAAYAWLTHADRDRCSPVAQAVLDRLYSQGKVA